MVSFDVASCRDWITLLEAGPVIELGARPGWPVPLGGRVVMLSLDS